MLVSTKVMGQGHGARSWGKVMGQGHGAQGHGARHGAQGHGARSWGKVMMTLHDVHGARSWGKAHKMGVASLYCLKTKSLSLSSMLTLPSPSPSLQICFIKLTLLTNVHDAHILN